MKKIKNLSIVILLLCSDFAMAGYFSGGSISYKALGNGQYLVTVNIIRDCAEIQAPLSLGLSVNSSSCSTTQTYTLNAVPGNPFGTMCPQALSTCNGGTAPGFQEWIYTCVVSLPTICPDWIFSTGGCCRTANSTSMSGNQYYYLEATLNNVGQENSSVVTNQQLNMVCLGQTSLYNFGSIDADGDSLVYSLIDAQTSSNSNVNYNSGYSGFNPVTSSPPLSLNPVTGDIQMHLTSVEYSVIAVRIDEYRNGNLIGYTTHNVVVFSVNCANNPPMINCPLQTILIEATEQFCYDFTCSDLDVNDTLTMTCNASQIPGSTFTVTGTPIPTGHFCWTPTVNDTSSNLYTITVTVRDQACPSNGVVSCPLYLRVGPFTGINETNVDGIKIFPNPASDILKIESAAVPVMNINAINVLGANERLKEARNGYDVSELPPGIYLLKVQLQNGEVRMAKLLKK